MLVFNCVCDCLEVGQNLNLTILEWINLELCLVAANCLKKKCTFRCVENIAKVAPSMKVK